MITGVFERCACRGKARSVGGVNVTCASKILLLAFGVGFDRNRLVADIVGAEVVGQVQLGCGAGLDTNGRTVQILGRRNTQFTRDKETLAVIVVHADKFELEVNIAREGPCGVAGQHVDFAGCQRGKACLTSRRHEFNSSRIAKHGSCNSATNTNVKAFPFAIRVGGCKADQASRHTTVQLATGLHIIKCASRHGTGGKTSNGQSAEENGFFHFYLFLNSPSSGD